MSTVPRLIAFMMLAIVSGVASTASATITITSDSIYASISNELKKDELYSIDTGGTGMASVDGLPGYSSTTTFSQTANSLFTAFDHVRGGDQYGSAYSRTEVEFKSDIDIPYTVTGLYSNSGIGIFFSSHLRDVTANSYVYDNYQGTKGVAAALSLGGTDGTETNYLQGSLTGTILANHSYAWFVVAYTQNYPNADLGALAEGNASIAFGVPEPFAGWTGLASCAGLVALRRRQRYNRKLWTR